jgi:hypothetical protein
VLPTSGSITVPSTTSPTPPGPQPTGNADTVPPGGGVSPTTWAPTPPAGHHRGHVSGGGGGGGVSPTRALAVTGAPTAGTVGVGVAFVAAGAFALWFTRRRRDA